MSDLLRVLPGDDERAIQSSPVSPRHLAGLLRLIEDATISGKIAKDVFGKMLASGEDASTIVARECLTQVADEAVLGGIVDSVMAAHPRASVDVKRRQTVAKKFLLQAVIQSTGR